MHDETTHRATPPWAEEHRGVSIELRTVGPQRLVTSVSSIIGYRMGRCVRNSLVDRAALADRRQDDEWCRVSEQLDRSLEPGGLRASHSGRGQH